MPLENSTGLLTTGQNKPPNLSGNLLVFNQQSKQRVLTFFGGEISPPIFMIKTSSEFQLSSLVALMARHYSFSI
jgi:hypothetical protein